MKERAIVTFVEDKTFLIIEVHNLYKSCLVSGITSNTDLIICAPKSIWSKLPQDPSFIIYLDTNSVSDNCSQTNSRCDLAWQGYHFVNSISCLVEHKSVLEKYNYILKTDCDVFITENFKNFFPNILYTGTGGYVNNDEVKSKLKDIAKKKGYRHQEKFNVGATWYGKSAIILKCSELTMVILKNILGNNFKDGVGKWPGWYRGVSSMYASELAVNHLVDNFIISKLFDGHSDYKTSWKTDGVYHIHCWHVSDIYSKHAFMNNKYDNIDPNSLNDEKTDEYCLKIALSNLSILHYLQKNEKIVTQAPKVSMKTIYSDVINNNQIDHYTLFKSSNNMIIFYIILPIIVVVIVFLKYKKII